MLAQNGCIDGKQWVYKFTFKTCITFTKRLNVE